MAGMTISPQLRESPEAAKDHVLLSWANSEAWETKTARKRTWRTSFEYGDVNVLIPYLVVI